jgi:hypothetical protein
MSSRTFRLIRLLRPSGEEGGGTPEPELLNTSMLLQGDQYIQRVDTFPDPSVFTVNLWIKITSTQRDYTCIWYWGDIGFNDGWFIGTDSDGYTFRFDFWADPLINTNVTSVNGAWYNVSFVYDGSEKRCYVDGTLAGTISGTNVPPEILMSIGGGETTTRKVIGNIANVKMWTAALTESEINQEMMSKEPIITNSLWYWGSMQDSDAGKDYSGLSNDFTSVGFIGLEDGPPALN